jgi:hypothetical protein
LRRSPATRGSDSAGFRRGSPSFEAEGATTSRPDGSGSVETEATNNESSVGPVWSPRGGEIAFQAAGGDRTWVYLVRAHGTGSAASRPAATRPGSPDGPRLAFLDNWALITINKNGTGRRRLSRTGEFVTGAAWSPKGTALAYLTRTQSCVGLPSKLETVSGDGKHVHTLARWSPDSLI